jgi:hypothetical protein
MNTMLNDAELIAKCEAYTQFLSQPNADKTDDEIRKAAFEILEFSDAYSNEAMLARSPEAKRAFANFKRALLARIQKDVGPGVVALKVTTHTLH